MHRCTQVYFKVFCWDPYQLKTHRASTSQIRKCYQIPASRSSYCSVANWWQQPGPGGLLCLVPSQLPQQASESTYHVLMPWSPQQLLATLWEVGEDGGEGRQQKLLKQRSLSASVSCRTARNHQKVPVPPSDFLTSHLGALLAAPDAAPLPLTPQAQLRGFPRGCSSKGTWSATCLVIVLSLGHCSETNTLVSVPRLSPAKSFTVISYPPLFPTLAITVCAHNSLANANQDKCNGISSPVNTCFMTIVGFVLFGVFCFV